MVAPTVGSRTSAVPRRLPLAVSAVSSFRRVKRRERISRTPLPCPLRVKGYGTYRLGALSCVGHVLHSVVLKQPERPMHPRPTPPLPAEAPTTPRPHHMPPHLLLDPVPHRGKAPGRVPDTEVVDPAPQNRIDLRDHPSHWLRVVLLEHLLELLQQRRARLPLRR